MAGAATEPALCWPGFLERGVPQTLAPSQCRPWDRRNHPQFPNPLASALDAMKNPYRAPDAQGPPVRSGIDARRLTSSPPWMAGIPTESPLVLRESLGSSHNRLTSAEDYARGFTFGLSARRSFGREECLPCRAGRPSLTPA